MGVLKFLGVGRRDLGSPGQDCQDHFLPSPLLVGNFSHKLGPKNFGMKNQCPKNFTSKSVGSKTVLLKKKYGPKKFWSKKNFVQKIKVKNI